MRKHHDAYSKTLYANVPSLDPYMNLKQMTAILHIPVEEYLLGVLPYEMNEAFPIEALKAQAVAARSYAIRKQNSNEHYDVTDNTNDQVYRGYQKENKNGTFYLQSCISIVSPYMFLRCN